MNFLGTELGEETHSFRSLLFNYIQALNELWQSVQVVVTLFGLVVLSSLKTAGVSALIIHRVNMLSQLKQLALQAFPWSIPQLLLQ